MKLKKNVTIIKSVCRGRETEITLQQIKQCRGPEDMLQMSALDKEKGNEKLK